MNYYNNFDTREHRLVFQFDIEGWTDKARNVAEGAVNEVSDVVEEAAGEASKLRKELAKKGEEAFTQTTEVVGKQLEELQKQFSKLSVKEIVENIKKDVEYGGKMLKQLWQLVEEGKLVKEIEKKIIQAIREHLMNDEATAEKIRLANRAHRAINGDTKARDAILEEQIAQMPKHPPRLYHYLSPLLPMWNAWKNRERLGTKAAKWYDEEAFNKKVVEEIEKEYHKELQEAARDFGYGVSPSTVEKIILDPNSEYYPYK